MAMPQRDETIFFRSCEIWRVDLGTLAVVRAAEVMKKRIMIDIIAM